MLNEREVLLFSDKREKLVQTLKSILDDRLVVENRSGAGLQGGHEEDNGDRKTEQLHFACWALFLTEFNGGVARNGLS